MRAIVQRVESARVDVDGQTVGRCNQGLLVLVGAHRLDTDEDAKKCAQKIAALRIFADDNGQMNLALGDLDPSEEPRILAVSNFTLYGNTAKGRRPSFVDSAPHERGRELYDLFVAALRELGIATQTGVFGTHMDITAVLDGPITLTVDVGPSGPVE